MGRGSGISVNDQNQEQTGLVLRDYRYLGNWIGDGRRKQSKTIQILTVMEGNKTIANFGDDDNKKWIPWFDFMHPVGLSGGHGGGEHSEQLSRNHLRCDSMCQGKSQFERTNSIFFEELLVILKFRIQETSGCSTVTEILATDHQSRTTPPPPSSPTELYSSHLCSIFSSPLFWEQEIFGGKVRTEQWRVSGSLPLGKARERSREPSRDPFPKSAFLPLVAFATQKFLKIWNTEPF